MERLDADQELRLPHQGKLTVSLEESESPDTAGHPKLRTRREVLPHEAAALSVKCLRPFWGGGSFRANPSSKLPPWKRWRHPLFALIGHNDAASVGGPLGVYVAGEGDSGGDGSGERQHGGFGR